MTATVVVTTGSFQTLKGHWHRGTTRTLVRRTVCCPIRGTPRTAAVCNRRVRDRSTGWTRDQLCTLLLFGMQTALGRQSKPNVVWLRISWPQLCHGPFPPLWLAQTLWSFLVSLRPCVRLVIPNTPLFLLRSAPQDTDSEYRRSASTRRSRRELRARSSTASIVSAVKGQYLAQASLRTVFDAWVHLSSYTRLKRAKLAALTQLCHRTLLSCVFCGWKGVLHWRRHTQALLRTRKRVNRRRLCAGTLSRWRAFVQLNRTAARHNKTARYRTAPDQNCFPAALCSAPNLSLSWTLS